MNLFFGKRKTALLALSLLIFVSAPARSQEGDAAVQQGDAQSPAAQAEPSRDPLRALNLTVDQLQQIRAIRAENRDEWRAVRQRLAQAHRALDEAVYSESVNESLIEERAREVGAAQAAVARMRALTELKIRRVLTPEQLSILRTLRQQVRANRRDRRQAYGFDSRPLRRGRRP